MRKYTVLLLIISILILTACGDRTTQMKYSIGISNNDTTEEVEQIQFFKKTPAPSISYEYSIRIDTNYMVYILDVPTVQVKVIETDEEENKVELKFKNKDVEKATIYLKTEDIKKHSEMYSEVVEKTLEIERLKEEEILKIEW